MAQFPSFDGVNGLTRHMKMKHAAPHVPKKTSSLQQQGQAAEGSNEKFRCNICDRDFKRKGEQTKHAKWHLRQLQVHEAAVVGEGEEDEEEDEEEEEEEEEVEEVDGESKKKKLRSA